MDYSPSRTPKARESVGSNSNTLSDADPKKAESAEDTSGQKKYLKWAVRSALLLVLVAVIIVGVIQGDRVVTLFEDFLNWVRNAGALGPIVFAVVYVIATVLFLPGLILTVGSGFVFAQAFGQAVGVLVASLAVFIGATIGASAAFILGRTILREPVSNYAAKNAKFGAVDNAIRDEGLKMVFLLRLSPLIPFNAFNYFAGITSVRFRSYFLASVGMIPGTVVYCFVGTTISNLSQAAGAGLTSGGVAPLVLIIVGTVLAVASVTFVSIKAKKAVDKAVAEAEQRRMEMEDLEQKDLESESTESAGQPQPSAPSWTDRPNTLSVS